jgi:hypothetical protein
MAGLLEELVIPVSELPLVRLETVEMVFFHLDPGSDYYVEKLEYMAMTNNCFYSFLDSYSKATLLPHETLHTALLSYCMLEEEAGSVPVITRKVIELVKDENEGLSEHGFAFPILNIIRRSNIFYYNALESYIGSSRDCSGNWFTAALVYRLFERQAELNRQILN